MENVFKQVKEAVARQAQAILSEYGIKHARNEGELKGLWTTGFLCPFCGDKSGSGSFTKELFFKCHQCSYKGDVIDTWAKLLGLSKWETVKTLGERCGVDVKSKTGRKVVSGRSMPKKMTDEILEVAMRDLLEHKDAEPAREMLKERGLFDERLLVTLGVGFIKGWIVFSRRDESGKLTDKYRGWSPNDSKIKWMWFGSGTGGPGIWPGLPAPDGAKVLLCEGEGDALTAMARLRMHENGWHVGTWQAGATSSPAVRDIPRSWHGKEVHVAYDNDVFQGKNYGKYHVVTKPGKNPDHARDAAKQRLRKLLEGVCPTLQSVQCKVTVRQCPVDAALNYGGDLRDWADAGGRDFADWKAFKFDDLPTLDSVVMDLVFDDALTTNSERVRTTVQIDATQGDDKVFVNSYQMNCDMGQHSACAACPGALNFPDGIIDMAEYPRHHVLGIETGFATDYHAKMIVQRPRACPGLDLEVTKSTTCSVWRACRPGHSGETTQRTMTVVSEDAPSLTGEIQVTGTIYVDSRGSNRIMHAESVVPLDKLEIDLETHRYDLLQNLPHATERIEDIDAFLLKRWQDLAHNVTRIHGRQDINTAWDLIAHSVLDFEMDGKMQRGWVDACVYGETRSGKSETFRRLIEHIEMGDYHTAVSNITRAGLVMGSDSKQFLKPGLFPRCNLKMLTLDEWHFLVSNALSGKKEHPMTWLQSGRDEGKVTGVMIYGTRMLPAKVRFCTIANWMRNKKRSFQYPCEHVAALYGSPETLARIDFALPVDKETTQRYTDKTDQFWTKERCRALVQRAWSMDSSQVHIDPEAEKLARKRCEGWEGKYDSEDIPLYTPHEKAISIMRLAISVANLTFSHKSHDAYSVHVREVHVEWAARWLEYTWAQQGYDAYSQARMNANIITKPLEAEKALVVTADLNDADLAIPILSGLVEPFTIQELEGLLGKERFECSKWISRMQSLHVFERVKTGAAKFFTSYCVTRGGAQLIGDMLQLANTDPGLWATRYRQFMAWGMTTTASEPENLNDALGHSNNDDDDYGQTIPF